MRFLILRMPMSFDMSTQAKVVKVLCCLHNFISHYDGNIMQHTQAPDPDFHSQNSGKLLSLCCYYCVKGICVMKMSIYN